MKTLVRWNEALRDGFCLKDREAASVEKLPRTLTAQAGAPILQPLTNADKQVLHTVSQQIQTIQRQGNEINNTLDTHIQGVGTIDESPGMHLLREMQQQENEMQATLQHQVQQQQLFQDKFLKRQELEHSQVASVRNRERSRDMMAIVMTIKEVLGERASELQERSQQISMREGVAGGIGVIVGDVAVVITLRTGIMTLKSAYGCDSQGNYCIGSRSGVGWY
ncbi:hypothetical protein Q7P35_010253 [Cladosporium inversicolor]